MNLNTKIFNGGLVKNAVEQCGGKLYPIIFDFDLSKAVALMNPSVFNDGGIIRCNVRATNYVLGHSEYNKYPHWSGPLQYIHPENDVRLATENWIVDFDDDFNVIKSRYCNMKLNVQAKWDFHGLEDGRLVRWDNKIFLTGVRRDTTDNGEGRMELSEFDISNDTEAIELSRQRIPMPNNEQSYCEKNWMPIIDLPFHYMKWANPTEIVKYDPKTKLTTRLGQYNSSLRKFSNVRGGSHVLRYKDYYIAFGHTVTLWKPYSGEKDSEYMKHVIVWDKDFNLLAITEPFKFINAQIEFCCGLCQNNNGKLLVSFAEMDNNPFILEFDGDWLLEQVLG